MSEAEFSRYKGHSKKFFVFLKIKVIEKLYNGDWIPNWEDTKQRKWYPYFYKDSFTGGWVVGDSARAGHGRFYGSVAYFRDEKTAVYVGKTYKDIYLDLIL